MTRRRILGGTALPIIAAAVLVFLVVTAARAEGPQGTTVAFPLPTGTEIIDTLVLVGIGEVLRRGLRKVDRVGEKCDTMQSEFREFRTRIDGALLGLDGRGGLVNELRDLQEDVARIENARRAEPLTPQQVGTFTPPRPT